MAIYFVGEYESIYSKLKNEKSISEYTASLKSSMSKVETEMNGVIDLIDELDGNYSKELRIN